MIPDTEMIKSLKVDVKVQLVAGVINATGKMLYWKDKGNYAIVENMNGFDLIKIVGIIETAKKSVGRFSNTKYEDMKNIKIRISKQDLEN